MIDPVHNNQFVRGILFGIVIGSLGATVIIMVGLEALYWLRARRGLPPVQFDVRAERVRNLIAECRGPDPDNKKTVAVHFEDGDA